MDDVLGQEITVFGQTFVLKRICSHHLRSGETVGIVGVIGERAHWSGPITRWFPLEFVQHCLSHPDRQSA